MSVPPEEGDDVEVQDGALCMWENRVWWVFFFFFFLLILISTCSKLHWQLLVFLFLVPHLGDQDGDGGAAEEAEVEDLLVAEHRVGGGVAAAAAAAAAAAVGRRGGRGTHVRSKLPASCHFALFFFFRWPTRSVGPRLRQSRQLWASGERQKKLLGTKICQICDDCFACYARDK